MNLLSFQTNFLFKNEIGDTDPGVERGDKDRALLNSWLLANHVLEQHEGEVRRQIKELDGVKMKRDERTAEEKRIRHDVESMPIIFDATDLRDIRKRGSELAPKLAQRRTVFHISRSIWQVQGMLV